MRTCVCYRATLWCSGTQGLCHVWILLYSNWMLQYTRDYVHAFLICSKLVNDFVNVFSRMLSIAIMYIGEKERREGGRGEIERERERERDKRCIVCISYLISMFVF